MENELKGAGAGAKLVKVFSPRLNRYIEVSLSNKNPDEDQLGGVMPVMLVTDHPLTQRVPD